MSTESFRDQSYVRDITYAGSAFPSKTINGFSANTSRPAMPSLTNQNSIPFDEDDGVGVSVSLRYDKATGPNVRPGDVAFIATKDTVSPLRTQSRYVLSPSVGGGSYPSQTFMTPNTFPIEAQNHVAINKELARVQFEHMRASGADMKSVSVQIEHLMSVRELLRFGRPCGILVQDNPSGTTGELNAVQRSGLASRLSKLSIRGRATIRNVFGQSFLGAKLFYVLKLKRVSQDAVYDAVPRSVLSAVPLTGEAIPSQFGGSVAQSCTKGYVGNTSDHTIEGCSQSQRILPGSPYIYQWVPAVNRFGHDLRAMGISRVLPVTRTFVDNEGVKHTFEKRMEHVTTGCVVSIASVITGIKDVDYGQQDIYRDYNAIPSMATVDVYIEMMNSTGEDVFELPDYSNIERIIPLGQEAVF